MNANTQQNKANIVDKDLLTIVTELDACVDSYLKLQKLRHKLVAEQISCQTAIKQLETSYFSLSKSKITAMTAIKS